METSMPQAASSASVGFNTATGSNSADARFGSVLGWR